MLDVYSVGIPNVIFLLKGLEFGAHELDDWDPDGTAVNAGETAHLSSFRRIVKERGQNVMLYYTISVSINKSKKMQDLEEGQGSSPVHLSLGDMRIKWWYSLRMTGR